MTSADDFGLGDVIASLARSFDVGDVANAAAIGTRTFTDPPAGLDTAFPAAGHCPSAWPTLP